MYVIIVWFCATFIVALIFYIYASNDYYDQPGEIYYYDEDHKKNCLIYEMDLNKFYRDARKDAREKSDIRTEEALRRQNITRKQIEQNENNQNSSRTTKVVRRLCQYFKNDTILD